MNNTKKRLGETMHSLKKTQSDKERTIMKEAAGDATIVTDGFITTRSRSFI